MLCFFMQSYTLSYPHDISDSCTGIKHWFKENSRYKIRQAFLKRSGWRGLKFEKKCSIKPLHSVTTFRIGKLSKHSCCVNSFVQSATVMPHRHPVGSVSFL